jgi:DNA polymerase-3 subunit alpha
MYADAYAEYSKHLVENAPVVLLGTVLRSPDGARLNVKECYPLEGALPGIIRKITWVLRPDDTTAPDFIKKLRESINASGGDTRVELAVMFDDGAAPIAEVANSLSWRVSAEKFQELRSHPAVVTTLIETRRPELKEQRRWSKRP